MILVYQNKNDTIVYVCIQSWNNIWCYLHYHWILPSFATLAYFSYFLSLLLMALLLEPVIGNPSLRKELFNTAIQGFAQTEALGLFALMMALIFLYAFLWID